VLDKVVTAAGVKVLTATLPNADADTLRQMCDRFRLKYPTHGVAVLASIIDERPVLIAAITEDLVKRGLHAGELVKFVAAPLGGGGGGKPTLGQAGGKDAANLHIVLESVKRWVEENMR
jgi:alanyl-tRNA synthetase